MKDVIALGVFLCLVPSLWGDTAGYLSLSYSSRHGSESATFRSPEVGLILTGFMSQRLKYAAEVSFNREGVFRIEQAWVDFTGSKAVNLELGVFPVPFGRYNLINRPHTTVLINAPLPVKLFFPRRWNDLGLLLEGKISGFLYSAYIGNGLAEKNRLSMGQVNRNNNGNWGYGGRIGLELSDSASLGYSRYWGKFDDAGERNLRIEALDGRIVIAGVEIIYERIWAGIENPGLYPKGKALGYSVQADFDIDRFRAFASFQKANYQDPFHGNGFLPGLAPGQGIFLNKKRWAVGLLYFPLANILFKLEYDWNTDHETGARYHALWIQAALHF